MGVVFFKDGGILATVIVTKGVRTMTLLVFFVGVFLLITILIGVTQTRGIKTFEDFALSKGFFGKPAILFTIVASFVGGGAVMGTANESFSTGIVYVVGLSGFALQLLVTGILIVPRLQRFGSALSLGDIVRQAYGKKVQMLVGVFWLVFCTGIIAVQIKSLGVLFNLFLPFGAHFNALIGAVVVIGYCALGGVRAVVATDMVQFIMMVIALPILLFFSLEAVGGIEGFLLKVPQGFLSLPGNASWLQIITLFLSFFLADALIPPVMQRILMVRQTAHALWGYVAASVITLGLVGMAGMFGMIARILNPLLIPTGTISYLIQTVLPFWGIVIVIFGMIAVIMSSADSYLNSAAVALVQDILKPLKQNRLSRRSLLSLGKLTTFIIGLCAFFVASAGQGILSLLLYTFKFWGPVVLPQIVAIFFSRKCYPQSFSLACIVGAIVVVGWEVFALEPISHMDSLIPGILVNGIVYKIIHSHLSKKEKKRA